ncbi:MAG: tetratricopeptide repeat protein [Bacteroidetes bacterium]|nr:tetratricopeptide repeat protein [Bacteroidota bacterium]
MSNRQFWLLFVYCLLSIVYCSAQQNKIDSLLSLLKKDKEDTNKVNHLNKLSSALYSANPDPTILLAQQAAALSQKINFSKGEANAYGIAGVGYWAKGDYPNALENYFKALKIDEALKNNSGMAKRLGNIGLVYDEQKDYSKALDYLLKALNMYEKLENKKGIAIQLGNIGIIYYEQKNYLMALDNYFKTLKIRDELGDKNLIASTLGNIGIIYQEQAISSNSQVAADSLHSKALDYFFKALKLDEKLGNRNNTAAWLGNIGTLYITQKKYTEAEKYLLHALAIDTTIGFLHHTENTEEQLSNLYEKIGKPAKALEHYKKAMVLKDTLFSEEKNKELTRKEMNYEFEKKEAAAKTEADKQQAVAEAESKKQKIVIWSVIAVLLLVVVFAGFIFRALRITQKQKHIIELQKKVVEEKQNEILASIRYAKRIQDAILPTEKYIEKSLNRLKAKMSK